ncbi:MAG: hypothetical protein ACI9MR_004467, partial [Myxococcota bacterium]
GISDGEPMLVVSDATTRRVLTEDIDCGSVVGLQHSVVAVAAEGLKMWDLASGLPHVVGRFEAANGPLLGSQDADWLVMADGAGGTQWMGRDRVMRTVSDATPSRLFAKTDLALVRKSRLAARFLATICIGGTRVPPPHEQSSRRPHPPRVARFALLRSARHRLSWLNDPA